MSELIEAAKRDMTLIYGLPGAGKTSLAMVLASRVANRVMWISTTEGPHLLKQTARSLALQEEKFAFFDFPRAFREDIAKYIVDHAGEYDALVLDSPNGLATYKKIDVITHSVLYQISHEKPVITIAEEETPRVAYIADHVIHVWYRRNKLGHTIRYMQLENKNNAPRT